MNRKTKTIIHHSSSFYYWENLIRQYPVEDMIIGNMGNKSISKDAVFVYIGFLDKEKEIFKCGWSVQKDMDTMIGYLSHVFFPTAFYSWLDRDSIGFYIPLSPFDVVKREVMILKDNEEDLGDANAIEYFIDKVQALYSTKREDALHTLSEICTDFNDIFDDSPNRKMYIRLFGSSEEIVDFILGDGEDYFEEVVEEEIGMSLTELRKLCDKVYSEPFINRTFIDHLNSEIPIWF